MAKISVIKLSSKGQIVIPAAMRTDLKEGQEFVITRDDSRIVLSKAENISEKMKEDLEFARRTEQAWQEYEEGIFTSQSAEEFLADLAQC